MKSGMSQALQYQKCLTWRDVLHIGYPPISDKILGLMFTYSLHTVQTKEYEINPVKWNYFNVLSNCIFFYVDKSNSFSEKMLYQLFLILKETITYIMAFFFF